MIPQDPTAPKHHVEGKWFEIRVTPDMVSDELLNIGVGFVQSRTKAFHFRLLDNANAFGCLYGPKGKEQFGFLLEVARQALAAHGPSADISEQISFGRPRFAQGNNPSEIVDALFRSVVTLARRDIDPAENALDRPSTSETRARIKASLKKRAPKQFARIWQDNPVEIILDRHACALDMPIWDPDPELLRGRRFATIISACSIETYHRKANFGSAFQDLTAARDYFRLVDNPARGGLFILRMPNDPLEQVIDAEIDRTTWLLEQRHKVEPFVEYTTAGLEKRLLEFVA